MEEAEAIVDAARARRRKLVIGYILRVHPAWKRFIELARTLGKPLVMRMNLNQQSSRRDWATHKQPDASRCRPIVDCGVHYVDVMCQMTGARPVRVSGIGARLTEEMAPDTYNYGQLQVVFDDGSVGWYEAGWGPMMSEDGVLREGRDRPEGLRCQHRQRTRAARPPPDPPTSTGTRRPSRCACTTRRSAPTTSSRRTDELVGIERRARPRRAVPTASRPSCCGRSARTSTSSGHWPDAVNSLRIVLAADLSVRTGRVVAL